LRLTPPQTLRQFDPDRILVGHGEGVFTNATSLLRDALDGSRRRAPWLFAKNVTQILG